VCSCVLEAWWDSWLKSRQQAAATRPKVEDKASQAASFASKNLHYPEICFANAAKSA
jgi:hypothetical protein